MQIELLNTKITMKMLQFSSYRVLPVLRRLRISLVQLGLLRLPIERRIW
jgi:hypothetical protein